MNKQEMKTLALSKTQDKINKIIKDIDNNIENRAKEGFFMYSFDYTKIVGFDIMNIIVEDFNQRGFSIEQFSIGNPIISIGWFRK